MQNLALNFTLPALLLILSVLASTQLEISHIISLVPTAFILGFVNFLIRPFMVILRIDLTSFRIGIFSFILNWLFFNVGLGLLDAFDDQSWIGALFLAVLMAIFQVFLVRIDETGRKPVT